MNAEATIAPAGRSTCGPWSAPTRSAWPAPSSSAAWPRGDQRRRGDPGRAVGGGEHDGLRPAHEPAALGHTRCRKFLQCIPMSETKTVGSMTERQRHALAQLLGTSGASHSAPERAEGLTPVLAGMA